MKSTSKLTAVWETFETDKPLVFRSAQHGVYSKYGVPSRRLRQRSCLRSTMIFENFELESSRNPIMTNLNNPISDIAALKCRFDTNGYVVLRRFLNRSDLAALESNLVRFIAEIVPTMPPERVCYEDKSRPETLKQLHKLHEHDSYFHQLYLGGRFEWLAESLLGDKTIGNNSQFFSKPPRASLPTPPHQDGYYFWLQPCHALTMWLALDHVDEENGCVRYVRGSHLHGMRKHAPSGVLGFSQGMTDFGQPEDLANEVPVPAEPGDLLVHHALTIHRADGNHSADRSRRSMGFIFFAAHSREDVAAKEEYQKRLKQQLQAHGRI